MDLVTECWGVYCEIALIRMSRDLTDDNIGSGNDSMPSAKKPFLWANFHPSLCRHITSLGHTELTHWGRVTHVCVSELTIIGSTSQHWMSLRWRRNGHGGVPNHQPYHCLLNRLFGCKSKKTSKLRVTGLCAGNSPGTGEFPAQMASNAENVSIWWRHHVVTIWRPLDDRLLSQPKISYQ